MTPAPITDERDDVTIDVAAGADWYDLDNVTKIGAGVDGKLTKYPSPYGVGTPGHGGRRAIIVTLRGLRRVVLVTPAVIYSPASDPVQVEHDRVKAAAIDIHNRHSADELDELQSL